MNDNIFSDTLDALGDVLGVTDALSALSQSELHTLDDSIGNTTEDILMQDTGSPELDPSVSNLFAPDTLSSVKDSASLLQGDMIEGIDFDGDGDVDMERLFLDTDGDGVVDLFTQIFHLDANADGIADTALIQEDVNMDGMIDNVFVVPYEDIAAASGSGGYETFDPNHYDPSTVVGDPVSHMENFHPQQDGGSCAVVAQEFILDEVIGEDFTEAELSEFAYEMGWFEYGPEGGTSPYDVGNILVAFGMNVSRGFGNDAQDLHNALANGDHVIVGVDADELWHGDNDFGPGEGANHAVQVIGIDYSGPEPMVILNDSGVPDGAGAMVPMSEFLDAWEDGDNFMVVASEA